MVVVAAEVISGDSRRLSNAASWFEILECGEPERCTGTEDATNNDDNIEGDADHFEDKIGAAIMVDWLWKLVLPFETTDWSNEMIEATLLVRANVVEPIEGDKSVAGGGWWLDWA